MKNLLILTLFLVNTASALDKRVVFEDKVIASIDGEPIVMSELQQFSKEQGVEIEDAKSRSKVLGDMVSLELLKREASKEGIEVSEEELENYVNGVAKQNDVSRARFVQMLKSQGLSLKKYKQQIKQEIIRNRVLSLRVRSKINVLDEDIEKYFNENPDGLPKEGHVHIYQISALGTGSMESLVKIKNAVNAGASMREVGGASFADLGYVDPADLKQELQEVIKDLAPGGVSKIVTTSDGTSFFVKLVDKAGAERVIPESLKNKAADQIYQELYQAKLNEYLTKELPRSYHVETNL